MSRFPRLERVLFLDIEVAPLYNSLEEVPEKLRAYWMQRYDPQRARTAPEMDVDAYFLEKSGIHALYSRVVCIGLGTFLCCGGEKVYTWHEKIIYDLDEAKLLKDFIDSWDKFRNKVSQSSSESYYQYKSDPPLYAVCGHNIQGFDIPFLGRRLVMNGLELPEFWREAQNAQPWQLKAPHVIDTMLLWSFTSRENSFIPLEILACALGLKFEKSLDHVAIRKAFAEWQEKGGDPPIPAFDEVIQYCLRDVRITAAIYLAMQGDRSLISKLNL